MTGQCCTASIIVEVMGAVIKCAGPSDSGHAPELCVQLVVAYLYN